MTFLTETHRLGRAVVGAWALGFGLLLFVACDRESEPQAESSLDNGKSRAPAFPVASPPTDSRPGSTVPDVPGREDREPMIDCKEDADCAFATYPDARSEADCSCPVCPSDSTAEPREEVERRRKQFIATCRAWAQAHPCPPHPCPVPGRAVCASEGQCKINRGIQ